MPGFSLVIEYLTGYAVATDPANRERAEWPPHPARVFMALAAAHFETNGAGKDKAEEDAERAALDWLAELPPPDLTIPEHSAREVLTVYVPVNDMEPGKLTNIEAINWAELRKNPKKFEDAKKSVTERLGTIPSYRLNKQPRTFPRVHVGTEPVRQTWHPPGKLPDNHLDALESICRNVTRIGHSSSLVWIWLERGSPADAAEPTLVPDESSLGVPLRTPYASLLRSLRDDYGQDARDAFQQLSAKVERLKAEKTQEKGKGAKARKCALSEQIMSTERELAARFKNDAPAPIWPRVSHVTRYSPVAPKHLSDPTTLFDSNFIVLREADEAEQRFGLESTAAITQSLRGLLLKKCGVEPVPSWVSGHEADGAKLQSGRHLALVPLAFVGREHADGHLLGVGIVLPRSIPLRERARALAPILFDDRSNQPKTLELKLGGAGVWRLVRETELTPKHTLRTQTYSGPSLSWASVTPVLLDRMPRADRVKDPIAWREEVAQIISQSCGRLFDHLDANKRPQLRWVRSEKTPFLRGSLRAMPGQGGFPQLREDKYQVHVAMEFDRPVQGPVLLGAGRFRGYGLMRPWLQEASR